MRYLREVAVGGLGLLSLLLIWGVAVEPYLIDREEQVAEIPALPASWEGQRVGLLADFRAGMWLANTGTTRRAVEQLVRERPALVLLAGDFIHKSAADRGGEISRVVQLVRPLPEAGIPTYAVLGEHDYGVEPDEVAAKDDMMAEQVERALEAIGVPVLDGEAIPLAPPSHEQEAAGGDLPLYLVGIGVHLPHEDKPLAAVGRVPAGAPRLVVMHDPASFAPLPAGTAPLAMAGHTLGGQIRVPFRPQWSWLGLTRGGDVLGNGWIEGYGQPGNRLYVNRGIGFADVPVRLFCPPELTIFTVRASRP